MKTPNINSTRHGLSWQPAFLGVASKMVMATACTLFALAGLTEAQTLQNRYSFASDASDSVGGANGTIVAPNGGTAATIHNGLLLPGGGGGGYSGYVSLPSGILTTTASITVEVWMTQNTENTWGTPWDFANSGSQNFALIPYPGNNNNEMETAFTPNGGEQDLQSSISLPSGSEQYVAVTFDTNSLIGNLYLNGAQVATTTFPNSSYAPGSIGGGTTVNALGNDIYGDPQFQGTIYEFRIWNGVVSPLYLAVSAAAGSQTVVTNTTIQSVSVSADPLVVNGNEQAHVNGGFLQASGVRLTALNIATNWISSNPGVLTVNSSGVITGVGVGTATVSATVNGVTGTSANITVGTAPVLDSALTLENDWSFNESGGSTAYDKVAGGNITLDGGTYLGGGVLTLPGGGGNWAQLPNGIISTYNSISIETWLTDRGGQTWSRAWSFGGSTTGPNNNFIQNNYIDLVPHDGNGVMRTEFNHNGDVVAAASAVLPTGNEHHTVVTYDAPSQTIRLYRDGVQVSIATGVTISPASLGFTYNNFIGLDQWNDPVFKGTIDEMRIWNGAISPLYQAASAAAGPGVVITNSTIQSVSVKVGPGVVLTGGTEQALANGSFLQVSGVPVTSLVTNWTSSSPSVLTVNGSGLITGVGAGTATVSATVNGVTGASVNVTVVAPSTSPVLAHRYSFVSDASDSVGTANGTIVGPGSGSPATISNGLHLPGSRGGGGVSGYVSLPNGIIAGDTSITVECWVTQNQGNGWAELWDFGNDGNDNFALIPYPDNNNNDLESVDHLSGNNPEVDSSISFPNGSEQYVTVTYNNASQKNNLYLNAVQVGSISTANSPGNLGGANGTTQNYLGNDVYGDWQFDGTVYELRIWNGAVSQAYLAASAVAGSGVVVTNLTPTVLTLSLSTTNMIGSQTQQGTVTGSFVQVSNISLTSAVTNWASSNPSVLSVNSAGLITANSGGSATVSATVDGVIATSATIYVSDTAPTISQAPASQTVVATETGLLSVQALGGNLSFQWSFNGVPIVGATNATLTLTNISFNQGGTYSVFVSNNIAATNLTAAVTVSPPVLLHRYSFVSDASDSVGTANGTPVPAGNASGSPVSFADGLTLYGGGGNDYSGYVALPSGILTNTASVTIECWVSQNQANGWATVWDFGSDGGHNFELCPVPERNINNLDVAVTPPEGELDTVTSTLFPSGVEEYVTYTFDEGTLTGDIYTNGVLAATRTYTDATYIPASIGGAGGTTENWLGNDVYGDTQFQGTIYELRIWNGAVTPLYQAVSAAAGSGVVVTNVTIMSVTLSVANPTMVEGQSQPATVLGNFEQASGVPLNSVATNWVSSNPAALTVDTNGNVTAVGTGSGTISATVAGMLVTSSLISVPASPPVITVNPAANQTLLSGVTFNTGVTNIGTPPFTYFWYTNSSTVPFITSSVPTLAVPNVQVAATASYTCVVSNQYGVAQSSSLALTVVAASPYQQAVEAYGALGYWPLNEAGGSTAYDEIGGNNGTYNGNFSLGNTGPTNAIFGASSLSAGFDGATAYVDIPEGQFNILGAITVVTWVQLGADNGFDGVFGHGDQSWRLTVGGSGNPGANDGSVPGDANDPNGINDGNWHMLAYVYNGIPGQANNGALYVDGALVGNNNVTVPPAGDNLDVWIGGSPDYGLGSNRRMMYGDVADAAIFTHAFNAAQVQGLFTGTFVAGPTSISISNSPAGIVLTWPSGTLLQSSSLTGSWITNSAATSPYTVPATNSSEFFKLLLP